MVKRVIKAIVLKVNLEDYSFKEYNFVNLEGNVHVIYESDEPRYYIDLDWSNSQILNQINQNLYQGSTLNYEIKQLGTAIGKKWALKPSEYFDKIRGTKTTENVEVTDLTDELYRKLMH